MMGAVDGSASRQREFYKMWVVFLELNIGDVQDSPTFAAQ
jgi:hypothetical protein